MEFEKEIARALQRKQPAVDFSQRVVSRLAAGNSRPLRQRWLAWAAAVLLTVSAGGWWQYQREQRRQGELAKEQLILALHIASSKLNEAQRAVQQQ